MRALTYLKMNNFHYRDINIHDLEHARREIETAFPFLKEGVEDDPMRPRYTILEKVDHHGLTEVNPRTYKGTAVDLFNLKDFKGRLIDGYAS